MLSPYIVWNNQSQSLEIRSLWKKCDSPTVKGTVNQLQMDFWLGQKGVHHVKCIHGEKHFAQHKGMLGGIISALLIFEITTTGRSGTACLVQYPFPYQTYLLLRIDLVILFVPSLVYILVLLHSTALMHCWF